MNKPQSLDSSGAWRPDNDKGSVQVEEGVEVGGDMDLKAKL